MCYGHVLLLRCSASSPDSCSWRFRSDGHGDESRGHRCHACAEFQQPVDKSVSGCYRQDIYCKEETYLDTRSTSKATLDLKKGSADLVLHGRPALLMMNGSSMGTASTAQEAATRLSGGGCSGCDSVVGASRSTTAGAKDGAARGSMAVSSCERHVGLSLLEEEIRCSLIVLVLCVACDIDLDCLKSGCYGRS